MNPTRYGCGVASNRSRWASLVLALLFLAAACGGQGDVDAQRVTTSPEANGEAVPTDDPEETDPDPPPPGNLAGAGVTLMRLAGMNQPLDMAVRGDDDTLYVAEKGGRIRPLRGGSVGGAVLDISAEVSGGFEQGLLGIDFSPDGSTLYVNFTNQAGTTIVRSYDFEGGSAQPGSARDLLEIPQPFANHNGGGIVVGPDGYLYISVGDGGSAGDPQGHGQNRDTLLGTLLRIDPSRGSPYAIPDGNPFVGTQGRDEIWAWGLRNPWRFSFDRATGDLWIADVGQDEWEEINFAPSGAGGGQNYGWANMEGNHSFRGRSAPPDHHAPIYEYPNAGNDCSVTGGYVYRGSRIPDLVGSYVFADYCGGELRAFTEEGGREVGHRFLGPQTSQVASFGEDGRGELYVLSLAGGVYRIDPAD
jgi:glucose/arabinose dehydrogenase